MAYAPKPSSLHLSTVNNQNNKNVSPIIVNLIDVHICRVFGEEVPSLKVLSVCSCGLTELFGADFLVNLTGENQPTCPPTSSLSELYAARNSINNVTDLSDLTKLKILDMEK